MSLSYTKERAGLCSSYNRYLKSFNLTTVAVIFPPSTEGETDMQGVKQLVLLCGFRDLALGFEPSCLRLLNLLSFCARGFPRSPPYPSPCTASQEMSVVS